jgi:hypothetical protein
MIVSPALRCGTRSAIVASTTPAGTISQTTRGVGSWRAMSANELAPSAPSFASDATASGDRS